MGSSGNSAAHKQAPAPAQAVGAMRDMYRNSRDMRRCVVEGIGEVFPLQSNCQAAQRGDPGSETACGVSDAREWWDQNVKGYPASDSVTDQIANEFGRDQGTQHPKASCDLLCAPFRPYGLPSKY